MPLTASDIEYALNNRVSINPDDVCRSVLREAGCQDRVFVVPEDFADRVSYLGDVLVQMLTRHPKDGELRIVAGRLCQSLSYLLNSSSWRDGELHDFDADEIGRKLRPVIVTGLTHEAQRVHSRAVETVGNSVVVADKF